MDDTITLMEATVPPEQSAGYSECLRNVRNLSERIIPRAPRPKTIRVEVLPPPKPVYVAPIPKPAAPVVAPKSELPDGRYMHNSSGATVEIKSNVDFPGRLDVSWPEGATNHISFTDLEEAFTKL